MGGTILDRIVETKRREVAEARAARPLAALWAELPSAPRVRDFYGAVTRPGDIRLIAEIKKASPSAGLIRPDFDPVEIARIYEGAGAAALSVLTDRTYFQGELSYIVNVRRACGLPVLRKDFILDEYQVFEARAAGADAILLIAEILDAGQIAAFSDRAAELGMATLIETHDPAHIDMIRPLVSPARRTLLGINNRDLHAQSTDLRTTERAAGRLPPGTPIVAESGIRTRDDVRAMKAAGACAVLIGETFMRAADIGAKVRELLAH